MKSNLMLSSFHPKSIMSNSATVAFAAFAGSNGEVVVVLDGLEFNMSKSEALGLIPFPFPALLVMTSAKVGHLAAMVGGDFFKMGLSMAVCLVVGRPFATKAIKARMNTKWRRARLISKPLRRGPEKKKIEDNDQDTLKAFKNLSC